jgi:hypothetical protein
VCTTDKEEHFAIREVTLNSGGVGMSATIDALKSPTETASMGRDPTPGRRIRRMSFLKMTESTSLRPIPDGRPRPIAAADELVAVIFAFEIVRVLIVEFPEEPYPVPMPEPELYNDDELVALRVALRVAFEIVTILIIEFPEVADPVPMPEP